MHEPSGRVAVLNALLNREYPAHGLGRWRNAEQRGDRWRHVDGVDDGQAHTCSNTRARGEEDAVQLATERRGPVLAFAEGGRRLRDRGAAHGCRGRIIRGRVEDQVHCRARRSPGPRRPAPRRTPRAPCGRRSRGRARRAMRWSLPVSPPRALHRRTIPAFPRDSVHRDRAAHAIEVHAPSSARDRLSPSAPTVSNPARAKTAFG